MRTRKVQTTKMEDNKNDLTTEDWFTHKYFKQWIKELNLDKNKNTLECDLNIDLDLDFINRKINT